jgi:hypothetical protein
MCPLPPEFPAANMRWALDVLSLRRFFSSDPLDTLNQTRVFAVDCETTLTDEELVALHHVGRLTPEGVREFAAERRALLRAYRNRRHARIMPLRPATTDGPRRATAPPARAIGSGHERPLAPAEVRGAATARNSRQIKGFSKRGK